MDAPPAAAGCDLRHRIGADRRHGVGQQVQRTSRRAVARHHRRLLPALVAAAAGRRRPGLAVGVGLRLLLPLQPDPDLLPGRAHDRADPRSDPASLPRLPAVERRALRRPDRRRAAAQGPAFRAAAPPLPGPGLVPLRLLQRRRHGAGAEPAQLLAGGGSERGRGPFSGRRRLAHRPLGRLHPGH